MVNPVHLLSNNNRLHAHIGYPVFQTIKLEQVKQKSLLKFLNISPVQKKNNNNNTLSVCVKAGKVCYLKLNFFYKNEP